MSASDQKLRHEWIQAVQTAIRLKAEGKSSLHHELKLRRREAREHSQSISQTISQSSPSRQNSSQSVQSRPSSQSEPPTEVQQPSSGPHHGDQESKETDVEIIDIIQQHLEKEAQRKEEEAQEKEKQKKKQEELERQLEEANTARESMVAELAKMEKEVQQQKKRIQELELTQQKLEEALNLQIQARLEEEKVRHELERQLEEEQKKLTELLLLQKQLETPAPAPIGTAETHQYNLEKISDSHSNAQYMRQWNVQLNRLMKPITPADKIERMPVKANCPKHGQALTSTEFINKYQTTIAQETEFSEGQLPNKNEEAGPQEPTTASEVEEP